LIQRVIVVLFSSIHKDGAKCKVGLMKYTPFSAKQYLLLWINLWTLGDNFHVTTLKWTAMSCGVKGAKAWQWNSRHERCFF